MLATGAAWLAEQQAAHAASEVVYSRGELQVSVRATRGRSAFQKQDADGTLVEFRSVDFIFLCEELVLDGAATEPRPGDRITVTLGDATLLYEVQNPAGGNAPCFANLPDDTQRVAFRVHTKFVGES